MKKRNWLGIAAMMAILCLTGCSNQEEEVDIVPTPTKGVENIFTKEDALLTDTVTVEDNNLSGLCEVLVKKDASEEAKFNSMNRMKTYDIEQQSLFCIDEDTGVVYYVNQNKDWYIYRLKDGVSELAVKLPARELYIWEGTVYFMLESYGDYEFDGINDGDIFSYTPADGSVELVYAASEIMGNHMQQMTVNENGIFFSSGIEKMLVVEDNEYMTIEEKYYHLPFDSTELLEDENRTTNVGWKNYYLAYKMAGGKIRLVLVNRSEESEEQIDLFGAPSKCCVIGDNLYYMTGGTIGIKNLVTGEEDTFDCIPLLSTIRGDIVKEGATILNSFTMAGDYIWTTAFSHTILRIDPKTKEIMCYNTPDDKGRIDTLYTDGNNLYALYAKTATGRQEVVQVLTEQIESIQNAEENPVLSIKYLTE